jgi:hypothetical protein
VVHDERALGQRADAIDLLAQPLGQMAAWSTGASMSKSSPKRVRSTMR